MPRHPPKAPPAAPPADPEKARQVAELARAAFRARAVAARTNPCLFCLHVLRDEKTGKEIQLAKMHREWLDAAERHRRLLIWASPGSGKTSLLSVGYSIYRLGRNPNTRIVILSAAERQSKKIIRGIKGIIEGSEALKEIADNQTFYALQPGDQWAETAITVKRGIASRDPSVQVFGKGGSIQGARPDLVIIDDLLTLVNSRTQELRDEMEAWFDALIGSRIDPGTQVIAVGNRIHSDDIFHRWEKRRTWHVFSGALLDAHGNPTWPERWPLEAIEDKRANLSPTEFKRQILCESVDEADAYFTRDMFDGCLERGLGLQPLRRLPELPPGCITATGVDLAAKKTRDSAKTAIFSLLAAPDGSRRVLAVESGKWDGRDIVRRVLDHHARYHSVVVVEDVSAQQFFLDLCGALAPEMHIEPFTTTGQHKHHPVFGIEGMAFEFRQSRWVIPNDDGVVTPEIGAWIQAVIDYHPLSHTPDVLMASWFAREYVRAAGVRRGAGANVSVRVMGAGDGSR